MAAGIVQVIHAGDAGELAVGLEHDDKLEAAAFEPPSDLHHFAKARMESVGDTRLSWLFWAVCRLRKLPVRQ
jgi:hypothetical protein